jgi:hypothetical protein
MLRYLLRSLTCVAPGLFAMIFSGCGGRGPLDTDIDAYDAPDAAALRSPDDQAPPNKDAGTPAEARDAGRPGLPALLGFGPDAGGIAGCFACAQASCGTQVNACISSPPCVQEGLCDLTTCLLGMGGMDAGSSSSGGPAAFGGVDLQCFMSCQKDPQGSADLFAAAECVFTSCGTDCTSALTSAGQGGLGGLGALGGIAPGGL